MKLSNLFEKVKEKKRKVYALALIGTIIATSIPSGFLRAGMANAEGETDITNAEGISYSYDNFTAEIDGNSVALTENNGVFSLPENTAITTVASFTGALNISVVNVDERDPNVFKEGNYFQVTFPEIFQLVEKTSSIQKGTETICNYTIKDNTITGVFTKSVNPSENLNDLAFGIAFDMTVNLSEVSETEDVTYTLTPDGIDPSYAILIPKKPTAIDAITKEGVLNEDNTITWTIGIGSEACTGASLNGITLNEDWGDGSVQEYVSAKVGDTDIDLSSGSYTFSDDSVVAPTTVTVVTQLTADAIKSSSITSTSNTASLTSEDPLKLSGTTEATAEVAIPKMSFQKFGEQIDGNTIEWKITVNTNEANVYGADVYDTLSSGLTVNSSAGVRAYNTKTKETVNLNEISASEADSRTSGINGYEIKTEEDGKQTIYFYFGKFSNTYEIIFDTNIGSTMEDNSSVDNQAFVTSYFPSGSGGTGGTSIQYEPADATASYKTVMIDVTGNGTNAKTGVLSWKIHPTSKSTDYSGAEITLSIPSDQTFMGLDQVEAVVGDTVLNQGTDYTASFEADKLTITFTKEKLDALDKTLSDVYVTFDTKAVTYFASSAKTNYKESAHISLDGSTELVADDFATQSLTNNLISKTVKSVYDDVNNEPEFIYTITVNSNELTLNDFELTDDLTDTLLKEDLSSLSTLAKDGKVANSGSAIDNEYYYVDAVSASNDDLVATFSHTDKVVKVNAATLSTKETVTITVKLTDAGKQALSIDGGALSQSIIYAKNTATVNATEITAENGISATATGLGENQILVNKAVVKDASQETADGKKTSSLDWVIDINNAGANMTTGYVVKDTIKNGLTLSAGSVKLYVASHGSEGTLISSADEEVTEGFSYSAVKQKDGSTEVEFTLPSGTSESYRLVYTTVMSSGAGTYDNTASVTEGETTVSDTKSITAGAFDWASGTRYAILTMTKSDSLSSSVFVKGAKYGIFASAEDAAAGENKAVDVGYTDVSGKITFTVPGFRSDDAQSYFVKELAVPDAEDTEINGGTYELDSTVYEIAGVTSGKHTIGPDGFDGTKTFVDERVKDSSATGTAELTNTFLKDSEGGKSSVFKLYILPTASTKVPVDVTKLSDGSYQFVSYDKSVTTTFSGTDSIAEVIGENSISSLKISGLPWGNYVLEEVSTADSFIKNTAGIAFTVKQTAIGCSIEGATNINNAKTQFSISDNVAADYEISGDFADGSTTKTLSGTDLTSGVVYTGLAIQGKNYTIKETNVPDGYKKHADVAVKSFDGDETVTITETPIVLNVVVKDQDGNEVSDAALSTQANSGTVTGATLNLNQNVSCGGSYDITGVLTNQYLPIDSEKVTVKVSSDGTSFTATPTDPSVMNASVSGTTVTIIVQKIKANVVIKEVSSDDETKILTGGTFELLNGDTHDTIATGIVDEKGGLTFEDAEITGLTVGNYYLMVTKAPTSYGWYDDSATHYEFTVDASKHNQAIVITVPCEPLPGTIYVTKTSEHGTKTLQGAQYTLYTKDDEGNYVKVDTQTTDAEGKMTFTNLLWNTYYLKETKAPTGYQLDETVHGGWVINETVVNQTLYKEVEEEPTGVEIKTYGIDISEGKDETEVSPELIGEGTYSVRGIFGGETEETTKTFSDDDNDGIIDISNEFVLGNVYTFTQTGIVSPYNVVAPFEVEITKEIGAGEKSIEVTNRMNRFAFTLVNEYGAAIGGAKFSIYDEEGNAVLEDMVSLSDTNGKTVDITSLTPGVYTLKETEATEANDLFYALDDSGVKFKLNADNTVEILSINEVASNLKKLGMAENDTVEGAVLGYANSTKITDEAVIEYVNTPTIIRFETSIRYNEDCSSASLDTSGLIGITYGIYTDEECTEPNHVANGTTDENGTVVVAGLPLGTYYTKMTGSDAGNVIVDNTVYVANVTGFTFEGLQYANGAYVSEGGLTLEVNRSDLTLTKTDKEDASMVLAGSTYAIYRKSSVGVQETTSYQASTSSYTLFELLGTKAVSVVQTLKGTSSQTTDASKDEWVLVSTSVTDENGKITFTGVDVGVEYLIQEISEPSGYQISKDPILVKFVMQDDGSVKLTTIDNGSGTASVDENGSVTWHEPRLKVAVRLVDENGNVLNGGSLQMVSNADSSQVRTWTTDSEDELFSGELTGGNTYTIIETAVPDGYVATENVTFTAESKALSATDDYIQVVTVVNKKETAASDNSDAKDDSDASDSSEGSSTDETGNNQTDTSETENVNDTKAKSPKTGDWKFPWEWFLR